MGATFPIFRYWTVCIYRSIKFTQESYCFLLLSCCWSQSLINTKRCIIPISTRRYTYHLSVLIRTIFDMLHYILFYCVCSYPNSSTIPDTSILLYYALARILYLLPEATKTSGALCKCWSTYAVRNTLCNLVQKCAEAIVTHTHNIVTHTHNHELLTQT